MIHNAHDNNEDEDDTNEDSDDEEDSKHDDADEMDPNEINDDLPGLNQMEYAKDPENNEQE